MKIINKRDMIKAAPVRFKVNYYGDIDKDSWVKGKTRHDLLMELEALDIEKATEKDIYDILDRDWTKISCDECGKSVPVAIRLGEEPYYESNTVVICAGCLILALNIIWSEKP